MMIIMIIVLCRPRGMLKRRVAAQSLDWYRAILADRERRRGRLDPYA